MRPTWKLRAAGGARLGPSLTSVPAVFLAIVEHTPITAPVFVEHDRTTLELWPAERRSLRSLKTRGSWQYAVHGPPEAYWIRDLLDLLSPEEPC